VGELSESVLSKIHSPFFGIRRDQMNSSKNRRNTCRIRPTHADMRIQPPNPLKKASTGFNLSSNVGGHKNVTNHRLQSTNLILKLEDVSTIAPRANQLFCKKVE